MELTIKDALQRGIAAHKKNKLKDAEHLYRAILETQPLHPDANHNLGVIAVKMDQSAAALPLFEIALKANSQIEQYWLSYIDALIRERQFETALQIIQQGRLQAALAGEKLNALEERSLSGLKQSSNNFLNKELNTSNVVEFSFDAKILDGIKKIASSTLRRDDFFCMHPKWSSDIQWESNYSFKSFKIFNDVFKKLLNNDGMQVVREHIAHKEQIMMYGGSLVIRSKCTATNFHVDWTPESGNNAFTLITPIIQPSDGVNLLFKDNEGLERQYEYEVGKCIAFGSHFLHSTEVGTSSSPTVLLSMNFGTDLMDDWDAISKTAANQGLFYRLPNGHFVNKSFN
jgi:tetratricopeptide (TPR) repeat protein